MSSNASLTDPPIGLALEYAAWHGWRDKVLGRVHPNRRKRIVAYARLGLRYHGQMFYTQTAARRELFNRKPGRFAGAHADCSQYSAACAHWSGVKRVNDSDWTGTLGQKGLRLAAPVPGCFVFFGPYPHVHMGIMVDKVRLVGFGTQPGPDENTLGTMVAYFAGKGIHGVEFRDVTRG